MSAAAARTVGAQCVKSDLAGLRVAPRSVTSAAGRRCGTRSGNVDRSSRSCAATAPNPCGSGSFGWRQCGGHECPSDSIRSLALHTPRSKTAGARMRAFCVPWRALWAPCSAILIPGFDGCVYAREHTSQDAVFSIYLLVCMLWSIRCMLARIRAGMLWSIRCMLARIRAGMLRSIRPGGFLPAANRADSTPESPRLQAAAGAEILTGALRKPRNTSAAAPSWPASGPCQHAASQQCRKIRGADR